MQLPIGDVTLGAMYSSGSQRARVITEAWIERYGYCLACEGDRLRPTAANTQVRDFECSRCGHAYELKSGKSPFRKRIVDGAYASIMRRINTSTVPSFLLLQYSATWQIRNLLAVHSVLITHAVIEQRRPLSSTARRSGWIGCNILLSNVPPEGLIPLVVNGFAMPRNESRRQFGLMQPFTGLTPLGRGWAASTLMLLHQLQKKTFTIEDAYGLEGALGRLYPKNKHIRAKIRQQLQFLRDLGILVFESRGVYAFASSSEMPSAP